MHSVTTSVIKNIQFFGKRQVPLMTIQSIPSPAIYDRPRQDDYRQDGHNNQNHLPGNDVTSSEKSRGIHFESSPAGATQSDHGQHAHGTDGPQNSKVIDFLNVPAQPANQSDTVTHDFDMSQNSDFSLSNQIQGLFDVLGHVLDLLSVMLSGTENSANENESLFDNDDADAFLPLDYGNAGGSQPSPAVPSYSRGAEPAAPTDAFASNEAAVAPPYTPSSGALSGTERTPTISEFKTIEPGEGPDLVKDANGKFVFNEVVDDSFLPEDVQQGMKDAVAANKDLSFFQDNFTDEGDMYQYLVHMANLESGGGASLANEHDAAGSGTGGSAGYMHLHMNYGLAENSFGGAPLNTEGWSQEEVLGDYSKYTDLTMKHIDGAYQSVGGSSNSEGTEQAMALWWTGNDSTAAGSYYMEALSGGTGVNHNTGSAYM